MKRKKRNSQPALVGALMRLACLQFPREAYAYRSIVCSRRMESKQYYDRRHQPGSPLHPSRAGFAGQQTSRLNGLTVPVLTG
jgi:hypothetical protein